MNDEALTELRELRARVYGPDADRAADAVARARLSELEEHARREMVAPEVFAAPAPADSVAQREEILPALPVMVAEPAAPGVEALDDLIREADASPASPPPSGRFARLRPTRPVAVAWIASVVLVALLAGILTYASLGGRSAATAVGARQVATVGDEQRGDDDLAKTWFGTTGDARSYTFQGLTILTTDQGWDDVPQACIVVVPTEGVNWQDRTVTGQLYSGCSVGAFPATAEFTVHDLSPSQLRASYPVGTSLQFVLVGDEVTVFADDGRTLATASAP